VAAMGRLVINGDEIYELDEECLKEKRKKNTLKNASCTANKTSPVRVHEGNPQLK
jgi:hypothetical protein